MVIGTCSIKVFVRFLFPWSNSKTCLEPHINYLLRRISFSASEDWLMPLALACLCYVITGRTAIWALLSCCRIHRGLPMPGRASQVPLLCGSWSSGPSLFGSTCEGRRLDLNSHSQLRWQGHILQLSLTCLPVEHLGDQRDASRRVNQFYGQSQRYV